MPKRFWRIRVLVLAVFVAGGPLDGWTATTATTDTADPNTDVNNDSNAVAGADGCAPSQSSACGRPSGCRPSRWGMWVGEPHA